MIAKVVSKAFAVAPSNTSGLAPAKTAPVAVTMPVIVGAVIVGAVKVLLVSVSEPVNEVKLSPCSPELNSASVPVKVPKSSKSICNVFALLLIVLFVSV